ncbi:hypothetical protein AGDE_03798 [Angomonas deanei]|uniref:Zinc-binding domain containing protein, putative n=1 Tax=Angomonas deanei TaxID=59799 RepID=A0A7G2CC29_9TRYP|nr:hypothetical protein AGDE_03798 [Angomonas deanei]CAD2216581.1 Zinc-binding domain containing protein, putative [Angomonas deanei]|eukprot:EPY40130.1 hypothetical protein AGDE_03798 [Angomonas deanei]
MLRATFLCFLRPREIMFTPPPLAKRNGKFICKHCDYRWTSNQVWVTQTTQKAYQGETCAQCGVTNKPFYIGRPKESIFNRVRTPHPVKPGASSSRHGRKLKHSRYNRRTQQGRH